MKNRSRDGLAAKGLLSQKADFWPDLHEIWWLPWQHKNDWDTIDESKFMQRMKVQLLKVSAPWSKLSFQNFQKTSWGVGISPPPLVRPRVKTVLSSLIFALQIKLQVEVFFKSSSLNVIFKLSRSFRRSYLVTTICSCLLEIISQLWLRITFNSPTISDVTELLVSQSWSVSQSVGGSVGQSVPIHSFIRSSVRPSIHTFIYAFIYSRFSRRLQKHPLPANSIS